GKRFPHGEMRFFISQSDAKALQPHQTIKKRIDKFIKSPNDTSPLSRFQGSRSDGGTLSELCCRKL
ncbi:hypothetical protein, partial [Alistipes putredinis]|uniref:hypothetical protein n=1 Tax=Alistipes putredinis TaxID=28117 RepID=UPI002430BB93